MDTNGTTTTVEETEHEERKVIDLQAAAETSREARIEAGKAGIRRHLKKFQAQYKTLTDAALKFREQLSISSRECRNVVDALQALRKQTNACLEFFNDSETIIPSLTSYFSATSSLYHLDGEKTARLILEMDLFQSLVINSYNESLSHARQRIDMHVALQDRLKDEAKYLRELIGHLEKLLVETPPPPIPCKSK